MNYRYFVTDWEPNGINHLLIINEYNEVVEVIDEGCFGINVNTQSIPEQENYTWHTETNHEGKDVVLSKLHHYTLDYRVWQVPLDTVLKHIAISPINDGLETALTIKKYLK